MKSIALSIILLLIICSCNNIQNKQKQEIDTKKSLRIVSLAQSITQEIECLGLSDNIVGATSYCEISKKNKNLIIGSSTDINIEKILLLKPDIVVASTLTQPNIIESLTKNGINVHTMGKAASFEEICNEFIELGKLLGVEEKANKVVLQSKSSVDSLKKIVLNQKKQYKVFFQIGAKPLFAVIPNTYMDDYINLANCSNIAYDLTSGTITREAVIQRNPDVIIVVTMGIVGEEEVNIWKTYKQLSAVKNNRIFVLNSDIACAPTPIAFVQTFRAIINNLYCK